MKKKKCKIYCRVSGNSQDISGQLESLPKYAQDQKWEICGIYQDDGISGATISDRPDFQKLLYEMEDRKFDILLVEEHDRITRSDDLAERGLIMQALKENNILLCSPTEGICDLGTMGGEIIAQIKLMQAAEERKSIRRRTRRGKIKKAKQGIPTTGKLPFARSYDKLTGQWSLDKDMADQLRTGAKEYLDGKRLQDIADELNIGYSNLVKIFRHRCGDTWAVTYNGLEPINFKIPRILDDVTIKAICTRIDFNKIDNRTDARDYAFTGFIKCSKCRKGLWGQTHTTKGRLFEYYVHPKNIKNPCRAFGGIPLKMIEKAVFQTIFENVSDEPSFDRAIKRSLPPESHVKNLQKSIAKGERGLKKIEKDLLKLVNLALKGRLKKETIQHKETELLKQKDKISADLESDKGKLNALPNIDDIKRDSRYVRLGLMDYFGSKDWLDDMTIKDKKQFLHWLFDGVDEDGQPYGIFINKVARDVFDYEIHCKFFTGARFLKGDNIDYFDKSLQADFETNMLKTFSHLQS